MRAEIGSEFYNVPICNTENKIFPKNTAWFISGRSALRCIVDDMLKQSDVKTVAIPSWCCESMVYPFLERGIRVKYYPVVIDDKCVFKQCFQDIQDCDVLLLLDYFGYCSQADTPSFDGIVIHDLTHSFFSEQYADADYYFGSLRKWAGFFTGGFAWKKSGQFRDLPVQSDDRYVEIRKTAMAEKQAYIIGQSDSKQYLNDFVKAEEYLECGVNAAADIDDIHKAKQLDVNFIKQQRRENALYLLKQFSDIAIFPEMHDDDCPLFVPIHIPDGKRDELRSYLIENEMYCPVHWPISVVHQLTKETERIYKEELSLVCDQRYTTEDMERLAKVIREFRK